MARHFLRLKLSLLAGAFRGNWQQTVGFVVMLVLGVPAAIGAAVLLYVASGVPELGGPLAIAALSALTIMWMVLPPIVFGIDNTLDPLRLSLLPLTSRQLAIGLLVAGAAGVGAVLTTAVVAGVALGQASGPATGLVAIVAGAAHVLWCLVLGRAITTALSARLRSRKGKDLSTMLMALSGLLFAAVAQVPRLLIEGVTIGSAEEAGQALSAITDPLSWTPLGWAAGAMVSAGRGDAVGVVARLALLAVGVWLAARWWMRSLRRTLETAESVDTTADDGADLIPAALRWVPDPAVAALAAKDLRYMWRVPAQRAQWLVMPFFAIAMVGAVAFIEWLQQPETSLLAAVIPMLLALSAINAFGYDRDAAWLYLAAAVPGGRALLAKNIAAAVVVVPMTVAVGVSLAVITGGFAYLPGALLAAGGLFLLTLAIMNATSIMLPTGFPESTTNIWSASGGQGCAKSLLQVVAFLVLGILTLPVPLIGFFAADLLDVTTAAGLAGSLGAVAWGALWWWASLKLGDAWLRTKGPEWAAALRTSR